MIENVAFWTLSGGAGTTLIVGVVVGVRRLRSWLKRADEALHEWHHRDDDGSIEFAAACPGCQALERKADADLARATAKWKRGLVTPPVEKMWPKIEPHIPRYDFPLEMPIGTAGNPVRSPLGHPAYASTLDDLLRGRE